MKVCLTASVFLSIQLFVGFPVEAAEWTNKGPDNLWHTPENWNTGEVPGGSEKARINRADDDWAVVEDPAVAGFLRVGKRDGNTGELDIRADINLTHRRMADTLGVGGGTGTVNQSAGSVRIDWQKLIIGSGGSQSEGVWHLNGGELEVKRGGLKLGDGEGSTGRLNITGGIMDTRKRVAIKSGGTFRVAGSDIDEIRIGSGAGSSLHWHQAEGGTLEIGIDAGGVTPVRIASGKDVRFAEGARLDIGFLEDSERVGSWDVMRWDGELKNEGLAFAQDVDSDTWQFEFIDTADDGSPDTLRVSAVPDRAERIASLKELSETEPEKVVRSLVNILAAETLEGRLEAVEMLKETGADAEQAVSLGVAAPALKMMLRDCHLQKEGAKALLAAGMTEQEVANKLAQIMHNSGYALKKKTADTLVDLGSVLGSEAVMPPIVERLGSDIGKYKLLRTARIFKGLGNEGTDALKAAGEAERVASILRNALEDVLVFRLREDEITAYVAALKLLRQVEQEEGNMVCAGQYEGIITMDNLEEEIRGIAEEARNRHPKRSSDIAIEEAESDNPVKNVRALFRLNQMIEQHQMGYNFFTEGRFMLAYHLLAKKGLIGEYLRKKVRKEADKSLRLGERGPNNRSFYSALAHAAAARHFPDLERADEWRAYAEGVWNDWYQPGDCYEPGYVAHNIKQVIELGRILGKTEELKSEKALAAFKRYRDQISPSGLAIAPGDGTNQKAYVDGLELMAEVTGNGTFLWAAQKAFLAGDYGGYRRFLSSEMGNRYPVKEAAEGLADKFGEFYDLGIRPEAPETASKIQHMYPTTYQIPDRMLLAPSPKEGNPYAAFYLNDTMETLHHASADNRGELYHYEVDGVMYLKRTNWDKYPGQTNTFVVTDSQAEFPFYYTRGKLPDRWYRASSNMRLLRLFTESERYQRLDPGIEDETNMPLLLRYQDQESPYGVFLSNPEGLAGQNEEMTIENVTLSLNTFPEEGNQPFTNTIEDMDGYKGFWYLHSNIAPAKGSIDMVIDDVFIAGPEGEKTLLDLERIPENLQVVYYEAGKEGKEDEKRVLSEDEVKEIIEVTDESASGGEALRITCRPGRTDLIFRGFDQKVHLTEEYRRIGFNYKYVSDQAEKFLRTPARILVNRLTCRSMYVDHQQGGVLADTFVEQEGKDSYGEMTYDGVYTYDSKWTRRTLLTEEGYLIVVDGFLPGDAADGMSGGPVWQLNNPPTSGVSWFDAVIDRELDRNLMVHFHRQRGHIYGVQGPKEYAVFDKSKFQGGEKEFYISVMVPHAGDITPKDIIGGSSDKGITTTLSEKGDVAVQIQPPGKEGSSVKVEMSADGEWSVKR